jgi:hypothetical protein
MKFKGLSLFFHNFLAYQIIKYYSTQKSFCLYETWVFAQLKQDCGPLNYDTVQPANRQMEVTFFFEHLSTPTRYSASTFMV